MTVTILEEDRLMALALSSLPVTCESALPISSKNASGFPSVCRRSLRSAPSSPPPPPEPVGQRNGHDPDYHHYARDQEDDQNNRCERTRQAPSLEAVDYRQQHHGDHPCQHHRHHHARHPEGNDDQSGDEQPADRNPYRPVPALHRIEHRRPWLRVSHTENVVQVAP